MISHARRGLLAGAVLLGFSAAGQGQTLTEKELGKIMLQGDRRGYAISQRGNQYARREEVDGKFRYVTFQGPGESFDRIHAKGVWIQDRLVYLAVKEGKQFLVDGGKKVELKGTPTSPGLLPLIWPSPDTMSYCVFASDGSKVRWYLDGKLQANTFSRLVSVPRMTRGQSAPLFVGASSCIQRVVGQAAAGKVGWDVIHAVHSSTDGATVYVEGERASLPQVYRNDKEILRERPNSFAISRDGKTWVAVVSRPTADGSPRTVVLQDGKEVAEVAADAADSVSQRLYLAGDGSTWVWRLVTADNTGAILKQPGKEDRKLEPAPHEFNLSDDGKREAYEQPKENGTFFTIDGQPQPVYPLIGGNTFRFGPGAAFAYVVKEGENAFMVVSHLGEGPKFTAAPSPIQFLPDGRPAYAADRGEKNFIVTGTTEHEAPADDFFGEQTLKVEGTSVVAVGTRGDSVIEFRLTP